MLYLDKFKSEVVIFAFEKKKEVMVEKAQKYWPS